MPITVGRLAVDPHSGELSPVMGVAVSADTGAVVPVTASSRSWRRREPDMVLAARTEEELLARQSFWRQVDGLQADLSALQHALGGRLVYARELPSGLALEEEMAPIERLVAELQELQEREEKRRTEVKDSLDMSKVEECIPLKELFSNDEDQSTATAALLTLHRKFVQGTQDLFKQVRATSFPLCLFLSLPLSFSEQNLEADGSSEDDKSAQRVNLARSELVQGVLTLQEGLDRLHADVAYWERRGELLLGDARLYFTGELIVTGDYTAALARAEAGDSENAVLAELLRRLIALLQDGSPFTLAPELLRIVREGPDALREMRKRRKRKQLEANQQAAQSRTKEARKRKKKDRKKELQVGETLYSLTDLV